MYLSQLVLNPRSREARRDGADDYELHSTLCRLFAGAPPAVRERVLFRAERAAETGLVRVLVQSQCAPDFEQLPRDYCAYPPRVRGDYGEKLQGLQPGQRLRFCLRGNPTVKKQGKRLGLREPMAQEGWLRRKLDAAGAVVLECELRPHEVLVASKHKTKPAAPRQVHLGVWFEGVLEVRDPTRLREQIAAGIGAAKGYGFGLLSVAPA